MKIIWIILYFATTSGFDVGKEYVYEQKGTLHIENPEQPLQSAGVGFRSKIVAQPKEGRTIFSIVDFESEDFNSESIDVAHHEFKYARNDKIAGALQQPFAASFNEGKIEEIEIGKGEHLWVRNVKKGVLSLFQLDLVKGRHEHLDDKQYHVKEDGLHGPCDTLYIVHDGQHDSFKVTKIKNLEKCDRPQYAAIGREAAEKCVKCEAQKMHPSSSTSDVHYDLKGTVQHYVIKHVWAQSGYLFKPHGEGKKVHVKLNRTLDLLEERDAAADISLDKGVEKEHSLAQEFPITRDLKTVDDLKHPNALFKHYEVHAHKAKFGLGLYRLAQLEYTDDDIKEVGDDKRGGPLFLRTLSSFASFDYDEINEVYQKYVLLTPEERKDSILHTFLDLLAAAGMNPHIMFGLTLIKNEELTPLDAHRFYEKLHLNLKEVSTVIIHMIADSCKSEAVKSHRGTWSACKFAASTVASGKGCKHAHDDHEEDHGTCSPDIVSNIFNYSVTPADTQNESESESTVYLRMAGNLGTRKAMHYLERFICPKWHASEPKRMAALWALKQASKHHPDLARTIALPVFHNVSEPSEIRIASFLVVLFSQPELYLLRHIAREMTTEPSDQVVAFVTSAFRSLAESKYPCHRELAHHMRYVLPVWDDDMRFSKPTDKASSRLIISSTYNPKYDYGGMTALEMIRSHDGFLPRNVYIALKDYRAGHSSDTLTLEFESWGMDKLLKDLLGPQPGSANKLWNFMGRRRIPRDVPANERTAIQPALHITHREHHPMYARLSMSIFGKTVDSFSVDEKTLATLQEEGKAEQAIQELLGKDIRKKHFYLTKDIKLLMPSELGVPVFSDFKQVEFIYAKREKMDLSRGDNTELHLAIKQHYLYDVSSYQMLGFAPEFTKLALGTGHAARTVVSWPLDFEATLAPLEGKLSLRRPLHLPWNVIDHSSHPFTFAVGYDDSSNSTQGQTELSNWMRSLYQPEELTKFDRHYFDDTFGVGLNVKGHGISKGLHQFVREVYHEMSYRELFYYMAINPHWQPREIKIYAVPAAENATKELDIDISYKFLEPGDERQSHFNVHDQIGEGSELPSTHVLKLDVNFKGDTKERKVAAELRYSFNHDLFNRKLQFFYDRTSFSRADAKGMKICVEASAKFPKPDWSLTNMSAFHVGKHIDARLDVHYGSSCEAGSSITIDGKFTHTDDDEQQQLAAAAAAAVKAVGRKRFSSRFLHKLAKKCHDSQQKGLKFDYYCYKLLHYSSRLGKFTADVQWKNYKPLLDRFYPYYAKRYVQAPLEAGFVGVIGSHITGDHGKLHVVSQVPQLGADDEPHTNMVVTTEDGHHHEHWEVPTFSKILEPGLFKTTGYANAALFSSFYRHTSCYLQSLSVRTFDGTVVDLPETDCYKVVAFDCSSPSRFLILARATKNTSLAMVLRVFIHRTRIEIMPSDNELGLAVRVGRNKINITSEHPFSHTYRDTELFRIKKEDTKWYTLDSESIGIHLRFDGNLLMAEVSPLYSGNLCGLCGDYNLDRNHELFGADGHLYNNTLEFAKSYVIPNPKCHPPAP
ncbi:vitellogenin-6-like [Dermacentor variabilis]|uniref:vitellogenin-6-like n=1 Tax=Dermacentor variabilis TaxID=34621 RepID=UPI003F5AE560